MSIQPHIVASVALGVISYFPGDAKLDKWEQDDYVCQNGVDIGFVHFSLYSVTRVVFMVYEHSSVSFLRGHISTDVDKQIALLLRPVGNRDRTMKHWGKSIWELWLLTAHPPVLLDYFVSWV